MVEGKHYQCANLRWRFIAEYVDEVTICREALRLQEIKML